MIRGNISEVKFVGDKSSKANGVDAASEDLASEDTIDGIAEYAKKLSERLNTVIAISGPIDVVADANKAYLVRNGHPMMSRVTGTGCMLSSAVGVFAAANPDNLLEATAVCISAYGYAGELAYEKVQSTNGGTGSFRMFLMDEKERLNEAILLIWKWKLVIGLICMSAGAGLALAERRRKEEHIKKNMERNDKGKEE